MQSFLTFAALCDEVSPRCRIYHLILVQQATPDERARQTLFEYQRNTKTHILNMKLLKMATVVYVAEDLDM